MPLKGKAAGIDFGYGTRPDGSYKGQGFLGALKRPDGGIMTEFSVGVNIDGKETDVPSIVPTLSKAEIDTLLNLPEGEPIPLSIVKKAAAHAKERIKQGKSPFYGPDDYREKPSE